MLSFGMSGFPFYSHDIGGFSGLPDSALYVRWAQLGLFSSHARAHGTPPREPWEYGAEAERIFRRYAELRYRLMPYIYSEAVFATQNSLPFCAPLVLEYQDDPTTYSIEDAYMFGRSLLVAPILDETNRRRVYLPQGVWFDYWTKDRITGGRWLEVDAPLDMLPLFVTENALLPYAPLAQHTGAIALDALELELYAPAETGEYLIHDEDRPNIRVSWTFGGAELIVTIEGAPGTVSLAIYGVSDDVLRGAARADGGAVRLVMTLD
jgi:alpha-D-xyloside xylohydrolase